MSFSRLPFSFQYVVSFFEQRSIHWKKNMPGGSISVTRGGEMNWKESQIEMMMISDCFSLFARTHTETRWVYRLIVWFPFFPPWLIPGFSRSRRRWKKNSLLPASLKSSESRQRAGFECVRSKLTAIRLYGGSSFSPMMYDYVPSWSVSCCWGKANKRELLAMWENQSLSIN